VERRSWAPSTVDKVDVDLRLHIILQLGGRPLASLRRAHVEGWAKGLPLAPQTVAGVFQTLATMLASAVDDERIGPQPRDRRPTAEDHLRAAGPDDRRRQPWWIC